MKNCENDQVRGPQINWKWTMHTEQNTWATTKIHICLHISKEKSNTKLKIADFPRFEISG